MPLGSWLNLAGGGWSMMGLIGGVLLAAWLTARLTRQKPGMLWDISACALPVFMAMERAGEECVPEFDYSRTLMSSFLNGTFLAFEDADGFHLATWRLAAIVMLVLFLVLVWDLIRSPRHGNTCLLFLLLFGACSVLLESLRYDRFLSITFVGLQHVMAALYLASGVLHLCAPAGRKGRQRKLSLGRGNQRALPLLHDGIRHRGWNARWTARGFTPAAVPVVYGGDGGARGAELPHAQPGDATGLTVKTN